MSLCWLSLQTNPAGLTCTSKTVLRKKELIPEMANPLKPTARTRKEMATARVWEKPTTSSRVASMPNPVTNTCTTIFEVRAFTIASLMVDITQNLTTECFWNNHHCEMTTKTYITDFNY